MRKIIKIFSLITMMTLVMISSAGCGKQMVRVQMGIIDTDIPIWQPTVAKLKKEGIDLELTPFSSYGQPNGSLMHKEIAVNAFQTPAFLKAWNQENQGHLVAIGTTYAAPMRIYSRSIKHLSALKRGDSIALPNDPANKARALRLLQAAGVLKLNHAQTPAVIDVTTNRHRYRFFTVDASQTVRDMSDATIAVVNNNFARAARLTPAQALASEKQSALTNQNTGIIVVNHEDSHQAIYHRIVRAFQSTVNQPEIQHEIR